MMEKITLFTIDGQKIGKEEMSLLSKIVLDKANNVAYALSKNYKKQNQRIEIYLDEINGNFNLKVYNSTDKYARAFEEMFKLKLNIR
jgi:hypothetical protein